MNQHKFWQLIDESRETAGKDNALFLELLKARLSKLDNRELGRFQGILQEYLNAAYMPGLWGAAAIMHSYHCPNDTFMDFREWLVAQGRKNYMAALRCPDSLADMARFTGNPKTGLGSLVAEIHQGRMENRQSPQALALSDAERGILRQELMQEAAYDPQIHFMQTKQETMGYLPRLAEKYPPRSNPVHLWPDWVSEEIVCWRDSRWEMTPALLLQEKECGIEMLEEAEHHIYDAVWLLEHIVPGCGADRELLQTFIADLYGIADRLCEETEKEEKRVMPDALEPEEQTGGSPQQGPCIGL